MAKQVSITVPISLDQLAGIAEKAFMPSVFSMLGVLSVFAEDIGPFEKIVADQFAAPFFSA